MGFLPYHITRWTRGSVLVSEPDLIPEDALRRAVNVRLDRMLGSIEARPGWTLRTAAAIVGLHPLLFLSRLFTLTATYGYAQVAGALYRLSSVWAGATSIDATAGTTPLTEANSPDGEGDLWKYLVNEDIAIADNGTTTRTMGIAAPTAIPAGVALAPDLVTQIDQMDDAAQWSGSLLSAGPSDTTTWWIETPSAITVTVPASTFGSMSRHFAAVINLDTLPTGDDLVKDDDYIHLWVRANLPERIYFLQIDIDVDSTTAGVATAFRHNYYHVRLASLTALNQGNGSWTKVEVRKSAFQRFGSDTTRDWRHARTFRLGVQTTAAGAVDVVFDDFKLRGGVGMEGDIEYTVTYRNSATGARGNPLVDADRVPQFTLPITTNRQRVYLTISNVTQGNVAHPGDTQIDTLQIWRRGGTFSTAVLVDEIADSSASPYLDDVSDATLILTATPLETDNGPPPTGSSRVLFGPGGSGHFFLLVNGHRCYFSKGYERGENRVENWGVDNFVPIGDGSARAVAGIATASRVMAWTTERTYNIVGIGEDTFLPVPVDGSRGCVGPHAVASGSGAIFFVSQDGIYADYNGRQQKLTAAIDPFFEGRTVDGQAGWSVAQMSLARLAYLNESTGASLMLLYAVAGSSVLDHFLVLKPSAESGQLTECFFGTSDLTPLRSLYWDSVNRELLGGGGNGQVYRVEDPEAYSDAGIAIPILVRTKSYDLGQPQHPKHIAHAVIEGLTSGQPIACTAYYDRAQLNEAFGTITTYTETTQSLLRSPTPTTRRRDIALELTGVLANRLAITRLGCFFEPQPEYQTYLDSGIVSFVFMDQLKRFEIDVDIPAASILTVYTDGVQKFFGSFGPTPGRQNLPYALPPGVRGRTFRVTLTSTDGPFLLYRMAGFFRELGSDHHYQERLLVQGV